MQGPQWIFILPYTIVHIFQTKSTAIESNDKLIDTTLNLERYYKLLSAQGNKTVEPSQRAELCGTIAVCHERLTLKRRFEVMNLKNILADVKVPEIQIHKHELEKAWRVSILDGEYDTRRR